MTPEALPGGFRDGPIASARAFRAALEAMVRPGTLWQVEEVTRPATLSVAAAVLILTLCDGTTPLHLGASLDTRLVRDWVTFHTGATLVSAGNARFAVGTWADLMPVDRVAIGLPDYPDYPDRSATLIVELPELTASEPQLAGPGIATLAHLALPETAAFRANRALFQMGFDTYFTCDNRLAGLPRSTRVEVV